MIPDRTLVESDGVDQFDVSAYFSDPDGDDLSYAATSTDSDVAGVRIVGATLAVTPIGVGTATVGVTAADPGGMSIEQDFLVQVVAAPGSSGGFFPIIPTAPQEVIGSSNSGLDRANLLSEDAAIVVPYTLSPMPGQAVVLRAIAFNLLGDPLPASAQGVACTWSSDGGWHVHAERYGIRLHDHVHSAGRGRWKDYGQGDPDEDCDRGRRHI